MTDPDLQSLQTASDAGDPAAQVRLAARLLTGHGVTMAPEAGVALLRQAQARGDASASAHLAVLAAMGVAMPQSWPQALELIAKAAAWGDAQAGAQLALLAAGPDDRTPVLAAADDCTALAHKVDVAAWLSPPPKASLSEAPRIRALRSFVSPAVCRWLVGLGAGRTGAALVHDPDTGGGRIAAARSNTAFELSLMDLDLVVAMVRARIAAATGLPVGAMEPPQLLHYAPGQSFLRHYDFSDPAEPGYDRDIARRGQRIATLLIYLNADYAGGETDFPKAGVRFRGETGDALMFANVDPAGQPDRMTLHAGLPPTAGEKWVFSQWIRDRAPGPPA